MTRPSAAALIPAALVAATLGLPAAAQDRPLSVLTTIGMIADVAAQVAGPCAQVTALMPPGTDPHVWAATPADIGRLAQADLVLYVDPALEARLAGVLQGVSGRMATLGLARAAFGPEDLLSDPEDPDAIDPHLWMDVSRWARIAPVIAEAIAAQRPDCAPAMAANVATLQAQFAALHEWVGAAFASIPEGQRLLVTAHDAFAYLADAYGIEASEAIEGISTAAEASIADVRAVAEFVVERRVPAVFVETTISPRTIEALVAEARGMGHAVVIGGALFSDAMGDAGTPEGSYIGMIRANTRLIVAGLGGSLPDWPAALADWAAAWGLDG